MSRMLHLKYLEKNQGLSDEYWICLYPNCKEIPMSDDLK